MDVVKVIPKRCQFMDESLSLGVLPSYYLLKDALTCTVKPRVLLICTSVTVLC